MYTCDTVPLQDPANRTAEYTHLAFNPDGTRLLSIGAAPDHQLDVWDVDVKEPLVRVVRCAPRACGCPWGFSGLTSRRRGETKYQLDVWDVDVKEPLVGCVVVQETGQATMVTRSEWST